MTKHLGQPDRRPPPLKAQTTADESLAPIYEDRIRDATNTNEVMGYWAFLAGVVLGFLGLFIYYMTAAATPRARIRTGSPGTSSADGRCGAAFPAPKDGDDPVGVGLALTLAAIAWFLVVFPGGWSLTTGNSAVIMAYVAGLAIIGIAGSVVPLATDARDTALSAAEQRTETAENATGTVRDDAAAASRESKAASDEREEDLAAEIDGLEGDNSDLRSSKAEFERYSDTGDHWRWRLVHDNGNIIASSGESFSSKSMAKKGLGSVKLNALGAVVNER